jgi:hypothetical protein
MTRPNTPNATPPTSLYQGGRLIYDATRLMVFGDAEVQGILVSVDPDDPDAFSFRTLTVRANVD